VSQDSMTSGWYYAKAGASAGQEIGPLSWEELYVLAQGGILAPADIVWNPRLPRGVTARQIPGLFPAPQAPRTPQPVTPPTMPPVFSTPAPAPMATPPARPSTSQPVEPLWEIGPAAVRVTPPELSAKAGTEPEIPDDFAEKLEETAAQKTAPEEPKPPRADKQNRSLPWLIVLLILVIAIAGVAAYFLYFRDAGGGDGSGGATTTASAPTAATTPMTTTAIWTKLFTPGDMPAARSYHAMAYDPTTDRTILFGGSNRNGKFDDTWAFDLASKSWTKVATTSGPSARDYAQMVYDPAGGNIILFGGSDASEDRNDLWAFDVKANTWTELKPSGILPQAREGHGMVYEPNTNRVLVFGGLSDDSGELLNDLWAYDLVANTWTLLNPSGSLPAERELASMAYCLDSQLVLVFGGLALGASADADLGDMWAYDPVADTWTQIKPAGTTPTSRQGHATVAAPALGGLLMFGGLHGNTDVDETWLFGPLTDTWTLLQRPAGDAPGARDGHAMAYDSTSGTVVLFGGFDLATELELADTWICGAHF
jgi:N-acetylneuraminic acid mutarotase